MVFRSFPLTSHENGPGSTYANDCGALMPRRKLNPRSIGSLMPRPGRDRETYFDAPPPGFGLRVSARSGEGPVVRTWVLLYRHSGRKRWLRLGDAEAVSLADARKLARAALLRVAKGKDPASERTETRGALTLG